MKNEKGITLATLVISIIVLLILASISVYSGISTIRYTNYKRAKSEIETLQANVNSWYDEYIKIEVTDEEIQEGQTKEQVLADKQQQFLNQYGVLTSDPTCDQTKLNTTIQDVQEEGYTIIANNFIFMSSKKINDSLGLDFTFDYLVNIPNRKVIVFNGVMYNGKKYYTAEDFGVMNVEGNSMSSITFDLAQGENTDIVLSNLKLLDNNGSEVDFSKFFVQYKKASDTIWTEATTSMVRFTDVEDENKIKYKFPVPEITNTSILNIEYNVKIYTSDKKIEKTKNITIESNNYVKTGLLLHLDGIDNTGNGHDNTAMTWKNLNNTGNDASLNNISTTASLNSGWGDNYLALDGVDDYVTGDTTTNGDITVEYVGKQYNENNCVLYMLNKWSTTITKPTMQLWHGGQSSNYGRMLVPAINDLNYREIGSEQLSVEEANVNGKLLYAVTKSSNFIKIYVNGVLKKEYTDQSFIERFDINEIEFTIGKWHKTNSYYSKQELNSFRIYNRALTDEEIAHNCRIDKYRFNL